MGRPLVRRLQRAVPEKSSGVTVLAYHLVGAGTSSPVDLEEERFRADMAWLGASGRVVSLWDADPAGQGVVLTFDDAYANFADTVWPILRAFGLPATLYVPTGFVDGGEPPIRGADLPACTWDQLGAMAEEGLDLGSHTVSHADLRFVSGAALEDELARSRALVETRTGAPCRSFCYPRAMVTAEAVMAARANYALAVRGGGRRWRVGTDPHQIPRVSLRRGMGPRVVPDVVRQRIWLEEWLADGIRQRVR